MRHSRSGIFSTVLFVLIVLIQLGTFPYGDFLPRFGDADDADWRYAKIFWPVSIGLAAFGVIVAAVALWRNKKKHKSIYLKLGVALNAGALLVLIFLLKTSSNYTD